MTEVLKEKLMLEGFKYFGGKHCWTTSLKNVLEYHSLHLSEEMLFGLGGGLGFIYWCMKQMPAPFIGTRYGKGTDPLINTFRRIGAQASMVETASSKKGYEELKKQLRGGEPVIVFVDMVYLPYLVLPEVAHFGGHTIVVFGLDEEESIVYISDRGRRAVTATIEELKEARGSEFPPFPPKNKLVKVEYPSNMGNLENGIREGIRESCVSMLNPPIKNIGLAGIRKWASVVSKWPKQFKGLDLFGCLLNTFIYIEIAGTGGSGFRPMYARFLKEASSILRISVLNEVAEMFEKSAKVWSEVATAALPDSWPVLKSIRELSIKKNKIFEEQEQDALEEMREISGEVDGLLIKKKVAREFEDLQEKDITQLLGDLQQRILGLYEIEKQAFEKLNSIIR